MTPKESLFLAEYLKDFVGSKAAIRAGYSENCASEIAYEILNRPHMKIALAEAMEETAMMAKLSRAWVLKRWMRIADADPNDLMQMRRVNCRYCHGLDHNYQWVEVDYLAAVELAIERKKPAPSGMGGFGFNETLDPNPECPKCNGQGDEIVHVHDTRKLRGDARYLYAGVKQTKYGIEIQTRDQDAALLHLARHLGLTVERKEISGPNGQPIGFVGLKADDLSDDQLAALINIKDAE